MKNLVLLLFAVTLMAFNSACTKKSTDLPAPNVILIYGDDVGFGDVGVYGSKLIPTPNIDKLATQGIMFTDGHCTSATCSPSRFSMLTGTYAFRHDVSILPPNAPLSIPTDIMTLPKLFQKAGYNTSVIGKWHLGIGQKGVTTNWNGDVLPGPLEIGFDYSFLLPSTNDRVPCVYLENHRVVNYDPNDSIFVGRKPEQVNRPGSTEYPDGLKNREAMTYYESTHGHENSVINGIGRIGYMSGGKKALWNDETMADEFVKQATKYIKSNKDKPFFMYYSAQDIHVPRAPHPRFQGKTELSYRGDAMVQFDWAVGEIMNTLEEMGIAENTIVIFSSDNGPVYDDGYDDGTTVETSKEEVDRGHDGSGIYRGGKYQVYEGGTRVPFIVSWPAKIKAGQSDAMVNQVDLLGSFANLLGINLATEEGIDSRDMLSTFLGDSKEGLPFMIEEAGRSRALRKGQWKYITVMENDRRGPQNHELYDLEKDPGEQNNIIGEHPEIAAEMEKELRDLLVSERMR